MASSLAIRERLRDRHRRLIPPWSWSLPSLSEAAFLIPIPVSFCATTGVAWLLSDSDTGWHIRTGEWILQNGRVPVTDLFSFTKYGQKWFAWEWLSDVAMGWLHSHGGLAAVVFASFVVLCSTSVLLYRTVVAHSGHRLVSFLLTWMAMGASSMHWLARPHLITPLLALLFCLILNSIERGANHRALVALPALTVLWVNLHGGFLVGLGLILTYCLAAIGETWLRVGRDDGRHRAWCYLVIAIICVLASCLNPYGYHLHVHVLEYLGSPFYLQYVSEFRPVDFQWLSASCFETLLVVSFASALWHLGKGRLVDVLIPLSWGHLALLSARHVPIFAVLSLPSMGLAIREWMGFARRQWRDSPIASMARAIEAVEIALEEMAHEQPRRLMLIPGAGLALLALLLSHPAPMRRMKAEFNGLQFPVQAAVALERTSSLRLFSSWQWGGYLIYRLWPSILIFNDGRTDFYGPAMVKEGLSVWNAGPSWETVFKRYGINAALLPVDSALASVLREREDWQPVYRDRIAILFAKRKFRKISEDLLRPSIPARIVSLSISHPGHVADAAHGRADLIIEV